MLSLLQSVEAISACRDRGRLPVTFSQSVVALLGDSAGVGVFIRGAQGDVVLRMVAGTTIHTSDAQEWGDFIEEVRLDRSVKTRTIAGRN